MENQPQMPTANSPQTTEVQQSIVDNRPKANSFLVILLSILLLISLAIAGFFAYQTQKLVAELRILNEELKVKPTSTPLVSSEPTTDPTIGWKMYTSKYGYTIKYPSTFILRTGEWQESGLQYGLQPEDEALLRFVEPDQPFHGGFPYGISISFKKPISNVNQVSIEDWAKIKVKDMETYNIKYSIQRVDITGISSVKLTYIFENRMTIFLIPVKNQIYEVSIADFSPAQSASSDSNFQTSYDYEKLFDQILSTFKFIE